LVHAKYQSADNGNLTAVSSSNWSKASMTENREAGVLIDGTASEEGAELTAYMQSVFENDFKIAYSLVPGSWSSKELAYIKNPSELPIIIPKITLPAGMYITPAPSFVTDNSLSTIQASPDSAWDTIQANLNSAEESIQIAMYQITTDDLCSQLLDMNNKGINVSLMVSSLIYDSYDCSLAQSCYAKLYDGGLRFRKSSTNYEYSHNKYWIIDGKTVSWSTGNWSPSDYPTDHSNTYPPYGDSDWWDSNRDFTGYTTSAATVNSFSTLFQNDWFVPETSDWSPDNDIYCGY
jgi:phosphatidylserine/phosphatidylglycerophosphate/cardiolipin synthase-like enzyme